MKPHADEILSSGMNKGAYKQMRPWVIENNSTNQFYIGENGPYISQPRLRLSLDAEYLPGKIHDVYVEYDSIARILEKAGGTDVASQLHGYRFVKNDDWYHDSVVNEYLNSDWFQMASQREPYVYPTTTWHFGNKTDMHGTIIPVSQFEFYKAIQIGTFIFHFKIRLWHYRGFYKIGYTDEAGLRYTGWGGGLWVGLGEGSKYDTNWREHSNVIESSSSTGYNSVLYHYFYRCAITDCEGNVCYISSRTPRTIGHEIFPFKKVFHAAPEGFPEETFASYGVSMRCLRTHLTLALLSETDPKKFIIVGKANSNSTVFLLAFGTIPYTWKIGVDGSSTVAAVDYVPNFAVTDEDGKIVRLYNPSYNQAETSDFLNYDRFLVDITNGVYVNREGMTYLNGVQYIANTFDFSRNGYEYYHAGHFGIAVPIIFRLSDEKVVIFDELYIARLSNTEIDYRTHDAGLKIDRGTFVWLCGSESEEAMDTARRNLLLKTMDYPLTSTEHEEFNWLDSGGEDYEWRVIDIGQCVNYGTIEIPDGAQKIKVVSVIDAYGYVGFKLCDARDFQSTSIISFASGGEKTEQWLTVNRFSFKISVANGLITSVTLKDAYEYKYPVRETVDVSNMMTVTNIGSITRWKVYALCKVEV